MDTNENNALVLKDISLSLRGPEGLLPILHQINLEVHRGETVSIVGPSGSGKTTLMMVIAGVEKASSGTIHVAGRDITQYNEDQLALFRRNQIGIVFQNFHLIPTMTALENVAIALAFSGDKQANVKSTHMLEKVSLAHRLHHYPSQLSGGEQQRVALARAMVIEPTLLLADEPTGSLDTETGHHIIDLLLDLKQQSGTTLIMITHDNQLAQRTSRSLIMQDGQLHEVH
ncbi:MAG: ABC transporter ATP-binding protein [Alphaproteobacteria bacterium]|nr:ABC transporter ATP-binding protein [Alphaproteobacteria bacterium]